jgi:hypothetical protein
VHPDSGEVLASELTTKEVGDLSMVGPLLEQIQNPLLSVIADGAYDAEPVYRAIAARQSDPPPAVIIPPRATAVLGPISANLSNKLLMHGRLRLSLTGWFCQAAAHSFHCVRIPSSGIKGVMACTKPCTAKPNSRQAL